MTRSDRSERALGFVEATAERHGIGHRLEMTVSFSNGERLWGIRYSRDADHAIVSEPLGDLPGAWLELPESTALVIEAGSHEQRRFRPQPRSTTANAKRLVGREV